MNTGNLKIIPDLTHHVAKNDENSYIPVTFLKNAGRTGGKLRPQKQYTLTRTITYEQYLFWCNSL